MAADLTPPPDCRHQFGCVLTDHENPPDPSEKNLQDAGFAAAALSGALHLQIWS